MTGPVARPDLGSYRRFVVAFGGGRNRYVAPLSLLGLAVPACDIERRRPDGMGKQTH